jgi:hypothetical protein
VDIHNEDGLAAPCNGTSPACGCSRQQDRLPRLWHSLRHFRRVLFPVGPATVLRDVVPRCSSGSASARGVQRGAADAISAYSAGVIMVLSGLAIWKPGQFQG